MACRRSPTPVQTPAVSAAPPALVNAIDSLLAGRYTQAATLDMGQFPDARARWHALLIRAAAKYTMSLLQGDANGSQLAAVQADIRAAKALNGSQQPDDRLFSPRFRALYQQKKIRPTTGRYHWIDTLYALSEATLYTGIVDAFGQRSQLTFTAVQQGVALPPERFRFTPPPGADVVGP